MTVVIYQEGHTYYISSLRGRGVPNWMTVDYIGGGGLLVKIMSLIKENKFVFYEYDSEIWKSEIRKLP